MSKSRVNYQSTLFLLALSIYILGIIHISLATLGLICFIIPIVQYIVYKDKIWCKYYCPRAGFFTKILSKISFKKKLPKSISSKGMKNFVLIYFGINLFFISASTLMVAFNNMPPMEILRFLIVFPLNIEIPQLITLSVPDYLVHLGYRIFSIMMSSTIVGIILGIIFRPRTWCIICPINSIITKNI